MTAWLKKRNAEYKAESKRLFEEIGRGGFDYRGYYMIGFLITAIICFILSWIYAAVSWGFLIGLGLGWIPSIFIGIIAGAIWPLLVLVFIAGLAIIGYFWYKSSLV